jgi:hypothetical protein
MDEESVRINIPLFLLPAESKEGDILDITIDVPWTPRLQRAAMPSYKPETVITLKQIYAERKNTVEYMIKFGNKLEKVQATLIKNAAIGVPT